MQIATDNSFANVVYEYDGDYVTSIDFIKDQLPINTGLYARAMHGHPDTGDSDWGATINFRISYLWSLYDTSNDTGWLDICNYETVHISSIRLTDGMVVVVYTDTLSSKVRGFTVSVAGSVVTTGTDVQLCTIQGAEFQLAQVGTTKILATIVQNSSGYIYYSTITVSGTSLTATAAVALIQDDCLFVELCRLSAIGTTLTKILICYTDASGAIMARCYNYSVSASTLTYVSSTTAGATSGAYLQVLALTTTSALMCYITAASYFGSMIITITDTSISFGSALSSSELGVAGYFDVILLTTTLLLVTYKNTQDSTYLTAAVVTRTSSAQTVRATLRLGAFVPGYPPIVALPDDYYLIFCNNGATRRAMATVISVNQTTYSITLVSQHAIEDTGCWSPTAHAIADGSALLICNTTDISDTTGTAGPVVGYLAVA